jgi:DNA polymerase
VVNEPALHIDFETRSTVDLKEVGLWNYARHPGTDAWCVAVALGEMEPELISHSDFYGAQTGRMFDHVVAGKPVYAHNAPFELAIWNQIMVPRYGWPVLRPEQTYCTMAQSYAMGLPGALEDVALALGLRILKDTDGRAIMLKYARPWRTEPLKWMDECPSFTVSGNKMTGQQGLQRLYSYCQQDVRVEREIHKYLMPLSERERRVWLLDYKINQRGVAIDVESAKAAILLAEQVKEDCDVQLANVTGNAVTSCTAVGALKEWLATNGLPEAQDGLDKQAVVDYLARGDLPERVRRALTLRQEAGKASNAKFGVMVSQVGDDGRLHNMYQYHGAGTGRWAGRAVQTHNLPRDMPKPESVERILSLVREGNHDAIDAIYGPPLSMISKCLRSFFVAPPGKVLVSGDWSNIEGRGQAWFAGEQWKLDAFKAADAKRGPGIYELAYARMFGVPVESVKNPSEERQVGKVSELAFGYQGGVGSFHVMAKTYGVKVSDAKADEFKDAWRAAHPRIKAVWGVIQKAAINAVQAPGEIYTCGWPGREAKYRKVGSFLWCLLPSGRAICYPYPKVLEGEFGPQLTYMTVPSQEDRKKGAIIDDPKNASNWARMSTYGGSLFNNIIQGACRDFLADCMLRVDEAGGALVLHTHDDLNVEVDAAKGEGARAAMQEMMRFVPPWAAGFPLHADCKTMERYGK